MIERIKEIYREDPARADCHAAVLREADWPEDLIAGVDTEVCATKMLGLTPMQGRLITLVGTDSLLNPERFFNPGIFRLERHAETMRALTTTHCRPAGKLLSDCVEAAKKPDLTSRLINAALSPSPHALVYLEDMGMSLDVFVSVFDMVPKHAQDLYELSAIYLPELTYKPPRPLPVSIRHLLYSGSAEEARYKYLIKHQIDIGDRSVFQSAKR